MDQIDETKPLLNGVLFRIGNKWYCHGFDSNGEFGLGNSDPSYIPKLSPMQVQWHADEIITAHDHTFIKYDNKWFSFGNNSVGQLALGEFSPKKVNYPIEIPINGISKIIALPAQTYICANGKWYVCGSNHNSFLGLGYKHHGKNIKTLMPIWWKPKKIYQENYYITILMENDDWYCVGLNNDDQFGLGIELYDNDENGDNDDNDEYQKYIYTPYKIKSKNENAMDEYNKIFELQMCTKCNYNLAEWTGNFKSIPLCKECESSDWQYDEKNK